YALAPRAHEFAVTGEDLHSRVGARENPHIIAAINGDPGHVAPRHAGLPLWPRWIDFIPRRDVHARIIGIFALRGSEASNSQAKAEYHRQEGSGLHECDFKGAVWR